MKIIGNELDSCFLLCYEVGFLPDFSSEFFSTIQ
jgi:hypothetical protein